MHFIDWIAARFGDMNRPDPGRLERALLDAPDAATNVAPHIREPDQYPYGRNVVFANDRVEAIVVYVPPGVSTPIHDHGESVGCALVVEGTLINTEFVPAAMDRTTVDRAGESRVDAGGVATFPAGTIHRMTNGGPGRLVSLHIYAPPLRDVRRYEEASECTGEASECTGKALECTREASERTGHALRPTSP